MSALTASIASIWSAVSRYGKAASKLHLHLAVGREGVAGADLALGVEVDQLAGHRAGGAPRAGLEVLPALAAERAERGLVALGPDVAADPRELVGGREDAVAAAVLQLEVVAGDPGERLGVEAGEAGDAVVLVDDVVADPQLDRRRQPGAGRDRRRPPRGGDAPGAAAGSPPIAALEPKIPPADAPRRSSRPAPPGLCRPRKGTSMRLRLKRVRSASPRPSKATTVR